MHCGATSLKYPRFFFPRKGQPEMAATPKRTKLQFTTVQSNTMVLEDLLMDLSLEDLVSLVDEAKAIKFFNDNKEYWNDYGTNGECEITVKVV